MAMYPGTLAIVDNNVGVSDICLLDPLTEDNLIHNLKQRFAHDQIYTYIGNVVVSVNPYKKIPLYTRDVIFEYRSRNIYELPPHIYAIADDAYRSMRDKNNDQCIIISGESGSGKTEASKVIMQYVAAVSGKGQDIDRVKEQLLQSNPVLEAFGNAKTNKNDNSSRFGKYMDIEFDFKGDPVGGVITNYLLEKSRVVLQSKGERNFHIFYQLLHGADTNLLKSLKLARNPEYYQFLQHGGCIYVDTIDDKQDFHITKRAMEVIGFTKQEVHSVWQLVASVLKLGNAQFIHHSNIDGTDGCRIHNDHGGQQTAAKEIYDVCDLLQTQSELLISALTQKTVQASGDKVSVDLSATEATYARDALCKAIYSRLFAWLVHRINDSIRVQSRTKRKSMGVLDIYGFEIFQCNSFEQFIINFCNEKLQQIFIELTLKEEQEEYVKEGIEWIHVDYFNNSVICELIEKSNVGILSLLDEECLRPGDVSDQTFLNKLNSQCCDHPHYESRGCKKSISDKTIPHDAFRLKHYAGEVIYRVEGFLDKNNDLLYRDLSRAMYNCDHALLKQLFPEGSPSKASLKRPPTAGSQLKASVTELMRNLLSKQPNYIRCIKPNDFKKGGLFEETLVRHQVRYLGLMENVRVRRAGYAFRQVYGQFLYRYKMLAEKTWPNWRGAHKTGVEEILTAQYIPQDEFAFGRTKIFIKNPKLLFDLEELRRERMHDLATLIQKMFRGWRMRVLFQLMKRSQIVISSNFRGYQARTRFQAVRNATITICSFIRGWKARRLLAQLKYEKKCLWAVGVIRKYYQGWKVRKEFRTKFRSNAGPKIIRFIQTALKRRFLLQLRDHLPSESPLARDWPTCSKLHRPASEEIRKIYHKWRCHKYRLRFDQPSRLKMKEKVVASDIFKDRKQNYPKSISHPYKGDYVSLRTNTRWKKVSTDYNDHHIMFADIVMKINRANGKMVPTLLVLSTNAIIIVDQRTLAYKYRLDSRDIDRISLSPYSDRIVVFHVKKYPENGNPLSKKGDFIFSCDHVIEIVAKAYLIAQRGSGKPIDVTIAHQFQAEFNGQLVDVAFKVGHPEIQPGGVKITRKSNKLEILQT